MLLTPDRVTVDIQHCQIIRSSDKAVAYNRTSYNLRYNRTSIRLTQCHVDCILRRVVPSGHVQFADCQGVYPALSEGQI